MAIPENRKIPASTQIKGIEAVIDGRVLPANPDQIINLNGLATKAWDYVYTAGTTMLFDVQRWYGLNPISSHPEYSKPREYFFEISKSGAREGNESVMFHSSLLTPERLVPNKPISPLDTYADQASMLADQVNQVDTEYYYYTGSTSAWLYNGVANGLITDYTELEEIAGWEEWGTKPEWLIITGDAYLVGVDNLNKMTANFYRRYDNAGITMIDVVVLNIEAYAGGNTADADKLNGTKIIDVQFNDNKDLNLDNELENNSIYNELIPVTVPTNQGDPTWNDLGNGNFSLQTGNNASAGLRAPIIGTVDPLFNSRIFGVNKLTIVFRMRIRSTNTTDSDRAILGTDTDGTDGFRFYYNRFNQALNLRIGNVVRFTPAESFIMNTHDQFLCGAVTYDGTDGSINFYVKSTPRSIPFTTYAVGANTGKTITTTNNIIRFNRYQTGSIILNADDKDYTIAFMEVLTPAQIESLMIENGPV